MNKLSVPLLSIASISLAMASATTTTATDYVSVEYKGSKSYSASDKVGNYAVQGVSGMTYNHILGNYWMMADTAMFVFDLEIDAAGSNTVSVSSANGVARPGKDAADAGDWDSIVFVDNPSGERPLYMLAAPDRIVWFNKAAGTVEFNGDGQVPDIIDKNAQKDEAERVPIGGIASLKGGDVHYVVYSMETALGPDQEGDSTTSCADNDCLRIIINEAKTDSTTNSISPLYQLRYDVDVEKDTATMGIADIAIFEDENKVLYGMVLEKNKKLYLVKLSGDEAKVEGAKDVSGCDSLKSSLSCSVTESISKRALYSFDSLPDDVKSLSFDTFTVIFRGDNPDDFGLIDNQSQMLLVAASNNAADTESDTQLIFLAMDTSDLDLSLKQAVSSSSSSSNSAGKHSLISSVSSLLLIFAVIYKLSA